MNKYKFDVTVAFLKMPTYKTVVSAINGFQAMQQAIKEHRLATGCDENEMYDSAKSTFQILSWTPCVNV